MMQCVRVRLQRGHLSVRVFSRGAICVRQLARQEKSGKRDPTPHPTQGEGGGASWTIDHGGVGGRGARDKKIYIY